MSETQNINEHIISFRGKASIPGPLTLDHDYRVISTVNCRRITTSPTDDGAVDITYVVEPLVSEVKDELGKVFEAKKKSKQSVAMRFQIISWMRDNYPDIDNDDEAYETAMHWILRDLPQILTWLKKKDEAQ